MEDLAVQLGVNLRLQNMLQHSELRDLLGLEGLRIVEYLPVAIAENVVEYQPCSPSMRALNPGARMVFTSVCPVLKSLPQIGASLRRDSSYIAGISIVRLGAPFAKGTPSLSAA